MADKSKDKVSKLCSDCKHWELFGKECHFFWERKKQCSNHAKGTAGNIKFKTVEFCE